MSAMISKPDDRVTANPSDSGGESARDRTLIVTGVAGAVLAAVCCATPLLAIVFGSIGVSAWIAKADYVLIPALIIFVALIGFGLYRSRLRAR